MRFLGWNRRQSNRWGGKTDFLFFLLWLWWFINGHYFSALFLLRLRRLRLVIAFIPSLPFRWRTCDSGLVSTKSFLAAIFSLETELITDFLFSISHKLLEIAFTLLFLYLLLLVFLDSWTDSTGVQTVGTGSFFRFCFIWKFFNRSSRLYFSGRIGIWSRVIISWVFLRVFVYFLKILYHK